MTYTRKIDTTFRAAWTKRPSLLLVAICAGLLLGAFDLLALKSGWSTILALAGIAWAAFEIKTRKTKILNRYHCPSCGGKLGKPCLDIGLKNGVADRVVWTFDCDTCEVTWDTNVLQGE